MIGEQRTGRIPTVVFSAAPHTGMSVKVNGREAHLGVVTGEGVLIAYGPVVAREAMSVAINCYRRFLKGEGHLRVVREPIRLDDIPPASPRARPRKKGPS